MNLATGSLMFLSFLLLLAGLVSKLLGMSVLAPFLSANASYFIAANTCLLAALAIDKFQK